MNALDMAEKARQLLDDPERFLGENINKVYASTRINLDEDDWYTVGGLQPNDPDANCFCVWGAVAHVLDIDTCTLDARLDSHSFNELKHLETFMTAEVNRRGYETITTFSDSEPHAKVLQMLDAVILDLQKEMFP